MSAGRWSSRSRLRTLVASGAVALSALAWPALGTAQPSSGTSASAPGAVSAAAPSASTAELETLRERAAAFWAARVAGDFGKQWELLEPRGRGRMTAREYASERGAVKYLAYQVEDATVSGYFAVVKIRVLAQPLLSAAGQRQVPPGAVTVEDNWVRVQGAWYRSLEQNEGHGPIGAPR